MRQVPHYLVIGRGRLASHMKHYFNLLRLSYSEWHRDLPIHKLQSDIARASHILILINDDAIEEFIDIHFQEVTEPYLIHCSGRLICDRAVGAHPLMTFSNTLYSLPEYLAIPFMIEEGSPSFDKLFPGLPNDSFTISKHVKEKYHAICALSGNLTSFLWQQLFDRFEREFKLSKTVVFPYVKQIIENLLKDSSSSLTGPLARGDQKTLAANLHSLENDHLKIIYNAFIESFLKYKQVNQ